MEQKCNIHKKDVTFLFKSIDNDCISYILMFISDSYTYNSICLSCSLFYKLVKQGHPNADTHL